MSDRCIVCGDHAEMCAPAVLCKTHWDMWWAAGAGIEIEGVDADSALDNWERTLLGRIEALLADNELLRAQMEGSR